MKLWEVEPWVVDGQVTSSEAAQHGPYDVVASGDLTDYIAFCFPGNAARIVACVNACEGINPEAVPDLLEALRRIVETCNVRIDDPRCDHFDAARAAIAKATTATPDPQSCRKDA